MVGKVTMHVAAPQGHSVLIVALSKLSFGNELDVNIACRARQNY